MPWSGSILYPSRSRIWKRNKEKTEELSRQWRWWWLIFLLPLPPFFKQGKQAGKKRREERVIVTATLPPCFLVHTHCTPHTLHFCTFACFGMAWQQQEREEHALCEKTHDRTCPSTALHTRFKNRHSAYPASIHPCHLIFLLLLPWREKRGSLLHCENRQTLQKPSLPTPTASSSIHNIQEKNSGGRQDIAGKMGHGRS